MLALLPRAALAQAEADERLKALLDQAEELTSLKTVIIARNGTVITERGYRGSSVRVPGNIKSASKSVMSALVGIAIGKGLLDGVEQKVAPILRSDLPANPDPRLAELTIGNLLSMQAGLERMSGANYGRWVSSRNWVRTALAQPFVDEPDGAMLYSTASTHLLSAILTRRSGRPTLALARDWFGDVEGFSIAAWARDPQGIYLGGNEMAMSPRSLLAFGELYRQGGRTANGRQVVPADWVATSWQPRTASRFTGDAYGYGWFLRSMGGYDVRYAWGYGGQMLYIAPQLGLTLVMTSRDDAPAGRTGYRDALHRLAEAVIAAVA